ncbi:MAG: hypothetical protein ABJF23_01100 [Bryobacteraceae bacterium]
MKNKIAISILAGSMLVLSGCQGEEEAREYAKGLVAVLRTYQAQLQAKAGAEQKAYKTLAMIYGDAADSDLIASLNVERRERGDRLADLAASGKTPTGTAIVDLLKDYASRDAESTRELLTRESHNYDKYLITLNKLSVDGDTIESAAKSLEVLTTKPSVLNELKFLKDFGSSAKGCLDESICRDLANALKTPEANLANPAKVIQDDPVKEKARTDALKAMIAPLKARQKSIGCEKKPTCPK